MSRLEGKITVSHFLVNPARALHLWNTTEESLEQIAERFCGAKARHIRTSIDHAVATGLGGLRRPLPPKIERQRVDPAVKQAKIAALAERCAARAERQLAVKQTPCAESRVAKIVARVENEAARPEKIVAHAEKEAKRVASAARKAEKIAKKAAYAERRAARAAKKAARAEKKAAKVAAIEERKVARAEKEAAKIAALAEIKAAKLAARNERRAAKIAARAARPTRAERNAEWRAAQREAAGLTAPLATAAEYSPAVEEILANKPPATRESIRARARRMENLITEWAQFVKDSGCEEWHGKTLYPWIDAHRIRATLQRIGRADLWEYLEQCMNTYAARRRKTVLEINASGKMRVRHVKPCINPDRIRKERRAAYVPAPALAAD